MKDHAVFIQTNHKQIVGALVAEYALKRNSQHSDEFDVQIMEVRDYPFFARHEGMARQALMAAAAARRRKTIRTAAAAVSTTSWGT